MHVLAKAWYEKHDFPGRKKMGYWVEIMPVPGQPAWFVPLNKPCDVCGVVQEMYYLCQPCADVMFNSWCEGIPATPAPLQSAWPDLESPEQQRTRRNRKTAYDKWAAKMTPEKWAARREIKRAYDKRRRADVATHQSRQG